MSGRIVTLAIILLLVATVSYIFYLNPETAAVKYKPGSQFSAPMALVLICTFFVGVLLTAFMAFLIGLKMHWDRWRLGKEARQTREHHQQISDARGELALGNLESARAVFKQIVHRDPDDVHARVMLAETYRREGDRKAALGVLEAARIEQKRNVELLLLAADIHEELGNLTEAYDNAALVLKFTPKNPAVITRLVRDCERLGRLAEAVQYQEQLLKLCSGDDYAAEQQRLASLELRQARKENADSVSGLKAALERLLQKHKNYPPALAELAELAQEQLNLDEASALWIRAFEHGGDASFLDRVASMWIEAENPAKAIASVRTVLYGKRKDLRPSLAGRLFFVKLLLRLEMIDEAQKELSAVKEEDLPDDSSRRAYALLKAALLYKEGRQDEAFARIVEALGADAGMLQAAKSLRLKNGPSASGWVGRLKQKFEDRAQPSPRLSTP